MSFDVFTIAALVDELQATLVGGRVQDVIDVDAMGIGFEIYAGRKRHYLYLGADAAQPRAHLTASKLRRGLMKPTQLGLACRRHVEGGTVTGLSQPAWERMLRLEIAGPEGDVALIAELMPRRANVLLLRDGTIVDCLNRVGPQQNRYRLSLPNHAYMPPPPIQGKLTPEAVTAEALGELLEAEEKRATQTRRLLPRKILGIGPLLAKELVFRATGRIDSSVDESDSGALFAAFETLALPLLRREWQPGIGYERGVASAFATFPLTFLEWIPSESVNAAISDYYGAITGVDAYKEAKRPAQAAIDEARAKLTAKMASLRRGLRDDDATQRLRQSGELILAYQYTLEPGQEMLRAQYEADGAPLEIRIEPTLSPVENAQAYFRRYEKAKMAREAVPQLIAVSKLELDFVAQLESDLALAANWSDIDEIIHNLKQRGHWQGKAPGRIGGGRQGPLRVVDRDGYVVFIGRNSRQNAALIAKTAKAQDLWLHARGAAGAHVIIRDDGRRISQGLIERAAAVAAHYSQKRGDAQALVDYTRVKYVRAIKGAGPGMVTYRNEKTLRVRPGDETLLTRDYADSGS